MIPILPQHISLFGPVKNEKNPFLCCYLFRILKLGYSCCSELKYKTPKQFDKFLPNIFR